MLKRTSHLIFILFLSALLFACGGGSGGGDGGGGGGPAPVNVVGEWDINETINDQACGGNGDTDSYSITVTQNGIGITVVAPNGTFSGTLNGSALSWTGQYQDPGNGWVSITSMSLNVSGNSFSGTANWDWREIQNGPVVCSGSTQVTGNKTSSANPPAAPSVLNATATSESTISLTWTNNTTDEQGFRIYRSLSDPGNYTEIATPHSGLTGFTDNGLSAATTYYYYIRAYNDAGDSDVSAIVFATTQSQSVSAPSTPTNLRATTDSTTSLTLTWTDVADETSYKILRSNSQSSGFTQTGTTAANSTRLIESGLTEGATYYYRVLASNSVGDSTAATLTVTMGTSAPVPNNPTGLSASNITQNSARISWTDNSNNETGFEIGTCSGLTTSTGAGYSYCESGFNRVAVVSANVRTYTFTNLEAETPYYYYVRAYNSAGSSDNRQVSFTTSAAPGVSTLKITNGLSDTGSNMVLQLRVATTSDLVRNNTNEILSRNGCIYLGPESIDRSRSETYTINSALAESGYYVFIGLGITDGSFCRSGYFEKKMGAYDLSSGNTIFLYGIMQLPSGITDGKDVDIRIGYYGGNIVARVYVDGLYNATINFSASYTVPTY